MSESSQNSERPKKTYTKLTIVLIAILLMLLVYGAGFIVLPMTILYVHQNKDCTSVVSLNEIYGKAYPDVVQDQTVSIVVAECGAFALAMEKEMGEHWLEAYVAYDTYSNTYPNGLYIREAREHGAFMLTKLAREKVAQQQFVEALHDLNLIVSDYADTTFAVEASNQIPVLYLSWGTSLREAMQFEQAEQVFNDFNGWLQNNQRVEHEAEVRNELAQTYLEWAATLQAQKQWEATLSKLDQVISVTPDPNKVAQANTAKVEVYIEWGNDLIEHGSLPEGFQKFETAIAISNEDDDSAAKDAMANGYIHVATGFQAEGDFRRTIEQLEIAQEMAATDAMKQTVSEGLNETYLAFSNSTGSQAQRAMRDALEMVCRRRREPEYPIFGLNTSVKRVGLYGADTALPDNLKAEVPGDMHFVACVEVENQTIESRGFAARNNTIWRWLRQYRIRIIWHISLRDVDTGDEIAKAFFEGGDPPPYATTLETLGDGRYYGSPPPISKVAEWLLSVIP